MEEKSTALIAEPIKNIANPVSSSIGKSLADIWDIVLGDRLSFAREKSSLIYAQKLEAFKEELTHKHEQIPIECIIEPSFQTVTQALEDSKYCIENDELRAMFVNLISHTVDARSAYLAHPSFSSIIKQLDSSDAKVFKAIIDEKKPKYIPLCYPSIMIDGTDKVYVNALPNWLSGLNVESLDIFGISNSLDSLERLGLVSLMYDRSIAGSEDHKNLLNLEQVQSIYKSFQECHPEETLVLKHTPCICRITSMGRRFADCCLPE